MTSHKQILERKSKESIERVISLVLDAYHKQRDEISDSDLDNEQPVSLNVRCTLGELRVLAASVPLSMISLVASKPLCDDCRRKGYKTCPPWCDNRKAIQR